ncbi:MAG: hypothetical protein AABX54_05730 [Nanoarchaeota archaeon]|mgnify:FL=1
MKLKQIIANTLIGAAMLIGCSKKQEAVETSRLINIGGKYYPTGTLESYTSKLGIKDYKVDIDGDAIGSYWYNLTYKDTLSGEIVTIPFEKLK